jgi:flagellar hook-length control protein FliK
MTRAADPAGAAAPIKMQAGNLAEIITNSVSPHTKAAPTETNKILKTVQEFDMPRAADNGEISENISKLFIKVSDIIQNISQLPGAKQIPAIIESQNGEKGQLLLEVSALLDLLKDYSEPIRMEISHFDESIISKDFIASGKFSPVSKSSLSFDLRDIIQTNGESKQITGVISTLNSQAPDTRPLISKAEMPQQSIESKVINTEHINKVIPNSQNVGSQNSKGADNQIILKTADIITAPDAETGSQVIPNNNSNATPKQNATIYELPATAGNSAIDAIINLPPLAIGEQKAKNPTRLFNSPAAVSKPTVKAAESSNITKPNNLRELVDNHQSRNLQEPTGPKTLANVSNDTELALNLPKPGAINVDKSTAELEKPNPAANIREVKSAILQASARQINFVKIRLHPANLGEVSIKLLWKNEGLSISLRVENGESSRMLNSSMAELKSGLEGANLKIHEINIVMENDRDRQNSSLLDLNNTGQSFRNARQQRESAPQMNARTSSSFEARSHIAGSNSPARPILRGLVDLTA